MRVFYVPLVKFNATVEIAEDEQSARLLRGEEVLVSSLKIPFVGDALRWLSDERRKAAEAAKPADPPVVVDSPVRAKGK